jgi:hypothetical protein
MVEICHYIFHALAFLPDDVLDWDLDVVKLDEGCARRGMAADF